ncbi:hypothetical protein LT493_28075 [Streptomyces tricolor]|nr:hypothetical protein [Streptomyces tricolor]
MRKCGEYGDRKLSIQTIDPKSGKVISEYKMPDGVEYAAVVSTDPLVIAADVGDAAGDGSGISDYFSIDAATGKLLARIPAPGDTYGGRCDGITRIEGCRQVVAGNGRLYLMTEPHDGKGDFSRTNEIVSFDLKTGKPTGQRAEAGDGYTLSPLRMDGGNLLAYNAPPLRQGRPGRQHRRRQLQGDQAAGEPRRAERAPGRDQPAAGLRGTPLRQGPPVHVGRVRAQEQLVVRQGVPGDGLRHGRLTAPVATRAGFARMGDLPRSAPDFIDPGHFS